MTILYKEDQECMADKDQVKAMKEAGWTNNKPDESKKEDTKKTTKKTTKKGAAEGIDFEDVV